MGNHPVFTRCSDRDVLHGYTLCQPDHVGIRYACCGMAGQGFLYQCLEAGQTPFRQYGHARGVKYGDRLYLQRIQYAVC